MKIEFLSSHNPEEHRKAFAVFVDGDLFMEFIDGDHEDNNLDRNFKDIYHLPKLIKIIDSLIEISDVSNSKLEIIQTQVDWNTFFERLF